VDVRTLAPTFSPGFQLTTYNVIRGGEPKARGLMKQVELLFEIPSVLLATTMPGLGLMSLSLAVGHLVREGGRCSELARSTRGVGETPEPGLRAV